MAHLHDSVKLSFSLGLRDGEILVIEWILKCLGLYQKKN